MLSLDMGTGYYMMMTHEISGRDCEDEINGAYIDIDGFDEKIRHVLKPTEK